MTGPMSLFDNVNRQFDEAADVLGLCQELRGW
jgi:hypothetical protein